PGRRGRRRPRRASRARGRGSGGKLPPAAPGAPRARSYTRWRGARRDRDGRERARLRRRRQHERQLAGAAAGDPGCRGLLDRGAPRRRRAGGGVRAGAGCGGRHRRRHRGARRNAGRRDARGDRGCLRRAPGRAAGRRRAPPRALPARPRVRRALENPLGGAPGFAIANVYVLPGLPAEMEAMFDTLADELRAGGPIGSWRRTYRTTESRIVAVLEAMGDRHPGVVVGSYPSFKPEGSQVEVVLKSADPEALAAATEWIEVALDEATQ